MKKVNKYSSVEDLPIHIFNNKECTDSPSKEMREYLRYMLENHPDDLAYIWRYMQSFKNYGGCYVLTFARWKERLKNRLKKYEDKEE
jgi:hypothetical protein